LTNRQGQNNRGKEGGTNFGEWGKEGGEDAKGVRTRGWLPGYKSRRNQIGRALRPKNVTRAVRGTSKGFSPVNIDCRKGEEKCRAGLQKPDLESARIFGEELGK